MTVAVGSFTEVLHRLRERSRGLRDQDLSILLGAFARQATDIESLRGNTEALEKSSVESGNRLLSADATIEQLKSEVILARERGLLDAIEECTRGAAAYEEAAATIAEDSIYERLRVRATAARACGNRIQSIVDRERAARLRALDDKKQEPAER